MTFSVRTIASVYLMVFTSNRHVRQTSFTAYVAYSLSSICNIILVNFLLKSFCADFNNYFYL